MDHKPYGVMLRGELPYAALQLAPRNLDDIPPIADTTSGLGATRAALRAQVEHENKIKQDSKEAAGTTRTTSRLSWRPLCGQRPD
eukprot:97753-Pleurochrysis_carterae.AAC.2